MILMAELKVVENEKKLNEEALEELSNGKGEDEE